MPVIMLQVLGQFKSNSTGAPRGQALAPYDEVRPGLSPSQMLMHDPACSLWPFVWLLYKYSQMCRR